MNASHMEEFDIIEDYLRHAYGDYPIGITKDQTRKCRNNYRFDEGILYYKKKTDTSLMLYDSSFNGHLSHELQVQIANIYRLAIKDKKIMVTALPVQQQTAGTLTCGVIAIALTYHFLVVIRASFLYICILYMFATRTDHLAFI